MIYPVPIDAVLETSVPPILKTDIFTIQKMQKEMARIRFTKITLVFFGGTECEKQRKLLEL